MDAEKINTIYDALNSSLEEMLTTEAKRGDLNKSQESDLVGKTNVYIKIEGGLTGHIYLSLTKESALNIVKQMAGMDVDEINDFAKSAISELANLMIGKASTAFLNQDIEIDNPPPEVRADASEGEVDLFGKTFISIPVGTDLGELELHVFLQ